MTGAGTGCTYGASSLEFSVFSGSPTLALVAHELANAETQNDAVPDLLSEVSAAEAGTSWSPTDAVASCLVAHFMGFQDRSAGPWQCPEALAATWPPTFTIPCDLGAGTALDSAVTAIPQLAHLRALRMPREACDAGFWRYHRGNECR